MEVERVKRFIDGADEATIQAVEEYIKKKKYPKGPVVLEIPYKFPSLNEYINACRRTPYAGATMKKNVQRDIGYFINKLPKFEHPVIIDFTWVEKNGRRDPDNVTYAKKFILDAMVECGKLKDDNRKNVIGFKDKTIYDDEWKTILEIREVEQ